MRYGCGYDVYNYYVTDALLYLYKQFSRSLNNQSMAEFGGYQRNYTGQDSYLNPGSMSPGLSQYKVPNINIHKEAGSPVNANELLSRSSDIKKQLSQSFQGGGSTGGIQKPLSRRNSAIHVKNEDDDEDDQGNERKRRDNINEKIQELLSLVPPVYFQEPAARDEDDGGTKSTGTKDGKPNKGQILTKSVEYIQYLQNLIDENNRKEVELQLKLKSLKMQHEGRGNAPLSADTTSAELALGEIGVGPHSRKYFEEVLYQSTGNKAS